MVSPRPILLIEDNLDDERLTIRALQRNQLTNPIQVARDGEEAIVALETSHPLPIMVLLDLKLPKIDGLEVLRYIRTQERIQLLPVIVFTSSGEERDIVESYRLGANSYVQKPVDFGQFIHAASQLGLYWLLVNEPTSKEV